MRSYFILSMGEEFGPFPIEFVRDRLESGVIFPWTWVRIVDDGIRVAFTRAADVIAAEAQQWQCHLIKSYSRRAELLAQRESVQGAIEYYAAALMISERLTHDAPSNPEFLSRAIECNYRLAKLGDAPASRWAPVISQLHELESKGALSAD